MSQGTAIPEAQNGPMPIDVDDTFEQQLTDMLKNGPVLDDTSPTVQGDITDMVSRASSAQPHSIPKSTPSTLPTGGVSTSTPTSSAPHSMTNIPLSSPDCNGPPGVRPKPAVPLTQSKLETLKEWSINTFKCTRQMISEKFGRGTRTVDIELETQIEQLRETQKKYAALLRQARALTHHFYNVIQTQRQLGELFTDMAQKSPDLQEELNFNAETEKILFHNGEALFGALNFFTSSVNTLCNKTMEDTLMTVKLYEQARIEFDAYRCDMEILQLGPKDANTISKLDESQKKFLAHKEKFEKLRGDVSIKLKFLEENKVKVMHKQLLLFHNAIAAYFSGNQTALESTLKQFNIKLKLPNTEKPSWIEQ